MTHGSFLLQAWVGCWGLKCKKDMRDDEADRLLSDACFARKRRFHPHLRREVQEHMVDGKLV